MPITTDVGLVFSPWSHILVCMMISLLFSITLVYCPCMFDSKQNGRLGVLSKQTTKGKELLNKKGKIEIQDSKLSILYLYFVFLVDESLSLCCSVCSSHFHEIVEDLYFYWKTESCSQFSMFTSLSFPSLLFLLSDELQMFSPWLSNPIKTWSAS